MPHAKENYDTIVERLIPLRVHGTKDNTGAIKFGRFELVLPDKGTSQQLLALRHVKIALACMRNYMRVAKYIQKEHNKEWLSFLLETDAEGLGVPQEFLTAIEEGK